MTVEEMLTDLFAHHFFENPSKAEEYDNPDFDLEAEVAALEAEAEQESPPSDWEEIPAP